MLLIGSRALAYQMKPPKWRKPSDWDFVCDKVEFVEFLQKAHHNHKSVKWHESPKYPGKFLVVLDGNIRCEFDCTENQSRKLLNTFSSSYSDKIVEIPLCGGVWVGIPTLPVLWAFKRSHAGINVHAEKTISDLIIITRELCKDSDNNQWFRTPLIERLLTYLKEEAEERSNLREKHKKINFNVPSEDFFKTQANKLRKYPHDTLHEVICRWNSEGPLYKQNLKYPDKALIDMEKFNSRTLEYRLTMVQEEAGTIGLERFYIHGLAKHPQQVYQKGLVKLIVDLSKGSFQDFILDHIHLLTKPKWDYMAKFLEAEESGIFLNTQ